MRRALASRPQWMGGVLTVGLAVLLGSPGIVDGETVESRGQPTELKIYKQRVIISSQVSCRLYEGRPLRCSAPVGPMLSELLGAEMLLKYTGLTIGDAELMPDPSTIEVLDFAPQGVNYSGEQRLAIELLYIK